MKSLYNKLALLALSGLLLESSNNYRIRKNEKSPIIDKELTPKQREERHRIFSGDQTKHNFIINGIEITASNKKTAIKIYKRLMADKKKCYFK